jgi:hypothetical protein
MGGDGSSVRGSEGNARAASRASGPANGPRGGDARARGRGGSRDLGEHWTSRGEVFSFFSFLFSITHFIFVSFLFEQTYLVDNIGIEK